MNDARAVAPSALFDPSPADLAPCDPPGTGPAPRRGGFTILEIMIATAILVIGLMGLLALFPAAMRSGTLTIEETNAMLIAKSVEQAIREGVQNRKAQDQETGRFTYFLFQHDGVKDPLPRKITDASPSADHYILFPSPDDTSRQALDRGEAYRRGKTFVFPETDGTEWTASLGGITETFEDEDSGAEPNGNGNPNLADDDRDDYEDDESGDTDFEVYRTYPLSNRFLATLGLEEDDEDAVADDDPISQYSFAFSLRPAYRDASQTRRDPTQSDLAPAGELYEAEILVFRSFWKGTIGAREPILRKTILVHR